MPEQPFTRISVYAETEKSDWSHTPRRLYLSLERIAIIYIQMHLLHLPLAERV